MPILLNLWFSSAVYVKKYPPTLSDKIWRINKIGKKGAFRDRLKEGNIESVEDFLKLLVMEPERLKKVNSASSPFILFFKVFQKVYFEILLKFSSLMETNHKDMIIVMPTVTSRWC